MDRNRIARIMERHHLDGLIATTQENVAYASGFRTAESRANYMTQIYAVVPRDPLQPVCLVIPTINLAYVAQLNLPADSVWTYGEFFFYIDAGATLLDASQRLAELLAAKRPAPDGPTALRAALNALDLGSGRLGLDEMGIAPSILRKLELELGNAIAPAYGVWRQARMVKIPEDIARLRQAAGIAEASVQAAIKRMQPGAKHRDIVAEFRSTAVRLGATPTHVNFRFGPNAGLPSLLPSDVQLEKGQLIAWDVGLIHELYQADTARCAALGEPGARQRSCYEALVAGLKAAIEAMRPRVTAASVFKTAVETVRRAGIPDYQRHHCGHGIGVEAYEEPMIASSDETVLEPGMVINVELPYYKLGFGSPVVEDTVVVTESGVEYLTLMDRQLLML